MIAWSSLFHAPAQQASSVFVHNPAKHVTIGRQFSQRGERSGSYAVSFRCAAAFAVQAVAIASPNQFPVVALDEPSRKFRVSGESIEARFRRKISAQIGMIL